MTGFIVSVFPFRNRVSPKEAFEGLELGEGKPSRPVLRGPGGRKAAWLLGSYSKCRSLEVGFEELALHLPEARLWIVSVRPTTRPESAKAGSDYFPGEF